MSRRRGARALPAILAAVSVAVLMASPVAAQPPLNDDVDDATVIAALPYANSQDTTEATTASDDPECAGNGHTVWYSFTPSSDIEVIADTFGSDFDTTLSVYTGSRGSLDQIACNDDSGSLQSRLLFRATAGVRYLLMIGSYFDSPGGALEVALQEAPPQVQLDVGIVRIGKIGDKGVVTIRGWITCSRPADDVSILGTIRQRRSDRIAVSSYLTIVDCDGRTLWRARTLGETARFRPGHARVVAAANYADEIRVEIIRDRAMKVVRLRRPH